MWQLSLQLKGNSSLGNENYISSSAMNLVCLKQRNVLQCHIFISSHSWLRHLHLTLHPPCVCRCSSVCSSLGTHSFLALHNTFGLNYLFSVTRSVNPVVLNNSHSYSQSMCGSWIWCYNLLHERQSTTLLGARTGPLLLWHLKRLFYSILLSLISDSIVPSETWPWRSVIQSIIIYSAQQQAKP